MTLSLFAACATLFAGLFVVGVVLCLPLFGWSLRRFFGSSLWTKTKWWIPIFFGFQLCLIFRLPMAIAIVGLLALLAIKEARRMRTRLTAYGYSYVVGVLSALAHTPFYFISLPAQAVSLLVIVCFASALSDVCAYFLGTYAGKHHLPAFINQRKSWEGVFGQLLGSVLGFWLAIQLPGIDASWVLGIVIGAASAFGDVANSIAKRQLGVKDWGQTIPGHGGVLDRFSSLSVALAASFWYALAF